MKKFIAFFVMIWNWIVSLFQNKKVVEAPFKEALKEVQNYVNHPVIPPHNNRKRTRGRYVQYMNVGAGRTRPIYHGAK